MRGMRKYDVRRICCSPRKKWYGIKVYTRLPAILRTLEMPSVRKRKSVVRAVNGKVSRKKRFKDIAKLPDARPSSLIRIMFEVSTKGKS
jgi:hypothetical protein